VEELLTYEHSSSIYVPQTGYSDGFFDGIVVMDISELSRLGGNLPIWLSSVKLKSVKQKNLASPDS
jgi:hypothetical protein